MTEEEKTALTENFRKVRETIAAHANGREITLLAATKTVDVERIRYATDVLGLRAVGENRVPELSEKYENLKESGAEIHLIGTLQKNKVKYVVGRVDLIHSLDSEGLALEIERQAAKRDVRVRVLIEINSGREESKGGILSEDLPALVKTVKTLPHVALAGLMTMAPKGGETVARKCFSETKALFDGLVKDGTLGEGAILSMGMSDTYAIAIEEGATLVRVGSALFGARAPGKETRCDTFI